MVTKGFTQIYGSDYEETFAPEAKNKHYSYIIDFSCYNIDRPLQQFDVKNDFLHGNLEEEEYMDTHLGLVTRL